MTAPGCKSENTRQDYTDYQKDDETRLDFAQARYDNSQHGRFTSIDPLTASANVKDPQTFNRYAYAMNSPYKFTDPLGLISSSTGACGNFCANWDGGGSMPTGGSREEATEQQAVEPEPPPAADDGIIDASGVVVDVPTYSQNSLELGGNVEFDETLTNNAVTS